MQDHSFVKFPKIPHLSSCMDILDHSVEVYEKIDGGNSQICCRYFRVLAGNRSHVINPKRDLAFWFKDFNTWAQKNFSLYSLPERFVLFGEWVDKKSNINYPYRENVQGKFFVLDAYDSDTDTTLDYDATRRLLGDCGVTGVDFLPLLFRGKTNYGSLAKRCMSSGYRDGPAEGVVIKDYSSQRFAKLWTKHVLGKTLCEEDVSRSARVLLERGETISSRSLITELSSDWSQADLQNAKPLVKKVLNGLKH